MAHKTTKKKVPSKTHNMLYNGKNWCSENLDMLREQFDKITGCKPEMSLHPIAALDHPGLKIVVAVVGSVPKVNGSNATKTQLMEDGRAAAQVGHAVSKLKLSYVLWLCQKVHTDAYDYVQKVMDQPITTIVVKARDDEELQHIMRLASAKNLHYVDFHDDNPHFYGTPAKILTAVAIGPYTNDYFDGITDYLPLWKSYYEGLS